MRVILTGGDGFLGESLVKDLPEHDFEIVDVKRGIDVTDELDMKHKVNWKDADCVIHLAGLTDPVISQRVPKEDVEVNLKGGLNVLMASLSVPYFIFASSCAVYGGRDWEMTEEDNCEPVSVYGVSKLAMEKYIRIYREEAVILRLANVYGPLDRKYLMYHLFHDDVFTLYDRGRMIREFLYIDDLVKLMRQLIANGPTGRVDVFNVGGFAANVRYVVEQVRKVRRLNVGHRTRRFGEMGEILLDSSKVQKTFNWSPQITLKEGVRKLRKVW